MFCIPFRPFTYPCTAGNYASPLKAETPRVFNTPHDDKKKAADAKAKLITQAEAPIQSSIDMESVQKRVASKLNDLTGSTQPLTGGSLVAETLWRAAEIAAERAKKAQEAAEKERDLAKQQADAANQAKSAAEIARDQAKQRADGWEAEHNAKVFASMASPANTEAEFVGMARDAKKSAKASYEARLAAEAERDKAKEQVRLAEEARKQAETARDLAMQEAAAHKQAKAQVQLERDTALQLRATAEAQRDAAIRHPLVATVNEGRITAQMGTDDAPIASVAEAPLLAQIAEDPVATVAEAELIDAEDLARSGRSRRSSRRRSKRSCFKPGDKGDKDRKRSCVSVFSRLTGRSRKKTNETKQLTESKESSR